MLDTTSPQSTSSSRCLRFHVPVVPFIREECNPRSVEHIYCIHAKELTLQSVCQGGLFHSTLFHSKLLYGFLTSLIGGYIEFPSIFFSKVKSGSVIHFMSHSWNLLFISVLIVTCLVLFIKMVNNYLWRSRRIYHPMCH